jgi:hypothetical protein
MADDDRRFEEGKEKGMSDRIKYGLAIMAGLLAIPGLAFAANTALTTSAEPEEAAPTTEAAPAPSTTTTMWATAAAYTAEDLIRACGDEGMYLVELEAAGAADALQLAALNAIRPICADAGLSLPPAPVPPEVEPIVETVRVYQTIPVPGPTIPVPDATIPAPPDPGVPNDEEGPESDDGEEVTTTTTSTTSPTTTTTTTTTPEQETGEAAAAALAARDQALVAINTAIEMGGKQDKINEAIHKATQGDDKYEQGDYAKATDHYEEALKKAEEALKDLEDDD